MLNSIVTMSQTEVSPEQAKADRMVKFYELDHSLTKEQRLSLGDYCKRLSVRSTTYSALAFGSGFAAVFLWNRRKIKLNTLKFAELRASNILSKEIFEKKLIPRNKFGLKAFLAGAGAYLVTAPFSHESARKYSYKILEDEVSDGEVENGKNVLEIANSMNPFVSFRMAVYYEATAERPELAIKDPRLPQGQQIPPKLQSSRLRNQRLPGQTQSPIDQASSSAPGLSFDSDGFQSEPADPYKAQSDSYDELNSGDKSQYGAFSKTEPSEVPASYGSPAHDEFDLSNTGLNGSSGEEKQEPVYGSAWDKVRSENNVQSNKGENPRGSTKWDQIRRNN